MVKIIGNFTKWVSHDGLLHIEYSAAITYIVGTMSTGWIGAVFSIIMGLFKEISDKIAKKSPWRDTAHDIICDIIGIAIGYLLWMVYAGIDVERTRSRMDRLSVLRTLAFT